MGLIKKAYVDPVSAAIVGAVRTMNLSDKEKDQLRKKYNLDKDSNLMLRNMGRGMAGGAAGAILGALAGGLTGNPGITGLLGLAGAATGTQLATNKYSKQNTKK